MVKANDLRPAFNAGEFSPRMAARVDFSKYASGAATVKNMLPLPQGGLARRPGTRFVAEAKDSSAKIRLLRFEFSTAQAYAIEAGNGYFRFYRNQGRIAVADTGAAIANGTFDSSIANWTDRSGAGSSIAHDAGGGGRMKLASNGTTNAHAEQSVANVASGVEHVLRFRAIGAPGDKLKLRIGTTSTGTEIVNDVEFATGYHAYAVTPSATTIYVQFLHASAKALYVDDVSLIDNAPLDLATPYATADLFSLKTAQSADVMYVAHPSHPVHKLARSGHTSWSLVEVAWQDGPYLDENATGTTLTASAVSGLGISITASATTGINGNAGFKTSDVGRLVRIQHSTSEPGCAVITEFTNATTVKADVKRAFNAATASTKWRLGSWSATTGYPSTCGFFEQRSAFARTTDQPQSFWMSQSADIENMRPDSFVSGAVAVEDDDALDYTFAAEQVNAIRWMSSGPRLVLGTTGGEWVAESNGPVITPTDITVRRHTTQGGADTQPVRVDHAVLFVQRGGRKLNEFVFSFDVDGYRANDMTILADHITRSGIVEMAYQQEPDSVVWCVRNDGVLASCTYRRGEDVVGWGRHVLGGSLQGGAAAVESVTTISGNNGAGQVFDSAERDEVWFAVKRTVGGATKRYVEFLEKAFEGPTRSDFGSDEAWKAEMRVQQMDAFCVDSGLTYDQPKAISGATRANPVVITSASHGFANGDSVRIDGVAGMTQLNGNTYKVAGVATNTFQLQDLSGNNVNGVVYATYVSGGEARKKVTSVGGLAHLEGETVKILADGAVHPDRVVASGSVALDSPAAVVQAGLGYAHQYQSLKIVAGAAAGTGVGKVKRIHKVVLLLLDATAARIGPDFGNLKDVEFREMGDATDTAVALFTGERAEAFDGTYEMDARVCLQGDAPAPFTLLAIAPELVTHDVL